MPYYHHYSVLYYGSNNSTRASGSFSVRTNTGTGITLGGESSLKINGNVAVKEPIASVIIPTYVWIGSSITEVSFVLTKKDGRTFTNVVKPSDIESVAFPSGMPTSFNKNSGISFNYVGTTGTVELLVEGHTTLGADTSYTKSITTNQVSLSASELSIFNTGSIEIHLTREKLLSVQASDDNAGGGIAVRYTVHNSFGLN